MLTLVTLINNHQFRSLLFYFYFLTHTDLDTCYNDDSRCCGGLGFPRGDDAAPTGAEEGGMLLRRALQDGHVRM